MQSTFIKGISVTGIHVLFVMSCALSCTSFTYSNRDGNRTPNQNVDVLAELNDSVFSVSSVNASLDLIRTIFPYAVRTTEIDRLKDSLNKLMVPKAMVRAVNNSSVCLWMPNDGDLNSLPADTGFWIGNTLAYHFGKEGCDSAWNLGHSSFGCDIVVDKGRFQRVEGGDTVKVADALGFTLWDGVRNFETGRYWLVVYYQNFSRKKDDIEYFVGIVKSDTAWMRFVDSDSANPGH
jgi:hypothetical protein